MHVDRVLTNVDALLDLLHVDVPFYRGCERPMATSHSHAEHFHGSDCLGDAGLSHTRRHAQPEHAAQALVRFARQYDVDMSIRAIGPLTKIALAPFSPIMHPCSSASAHRPSVARMMSIEPALTVSTSG